MVGFGTYSPSNVWHSVAQIQILIIILLLAKLITAVCTSCLFPNNSILENLATPVLW